MIAAVIAVTLGLSPQRFEVVAQHIAWEDLAPALFDQRWNLPEEPGGRKFEEQMRKLAKLTFRDRGGVRRFGDLVVEAPRGGRAAKTAWLDGLAARAPGLCAEWWDALRQLFLDDRLFGEDWDPAEDHARDGLLMAQGWELGKRGTGAWKGLEARFEQAAALFDADLAAIKRVENDFSTYPRHVGADYIDIRPVLGAHLTGKDDSGQPFRFVRIRFRSDLPFPYSWYACDLRMLNRIDAEGNLRTDIYSTSADFHYLAGRDVFLPVKNSAEETVAYLVVRDFGFDIEGVPDSAQHRAEALRGALGNLKRMAERSFRRTAEPFPTAQAVLSELRVFGED